MTPSAPLQLRSILDHFGYQPTEIQRIPSGNDTFRVHLLGGAQLLVKLQKNHEGNFLKEQRVVRALAPKAAFVPRLLHTQNEFPASARLFSIFEYVESVTLRDGVFNNRDDLMRKLGQLFYELRQVDPTDIIEASAELLEWSLGLIEEQKQLVSGHRASEALLDCVARLRATHRVSLVHGDPQLCQVLVDPRGSLYLVDFETASLGDPLENVALFPPTASDALLFLQGYEQQQQLTTPERRRVDLWRWYGHLHGLNAAAENYAARRAEIEARAEAFWQKWGGY